MVGNWEWDFASGAATWSDGLYRLLGIEPGAGKASYELFLNSIHPEDRAAALADGAAAVREGRNIDAVYRVVKQDGEIRWLASKGEVFTEPDGTPSWAAGALFDITEIREVQRELVAWEERYRALATANSLGEWRATASGDIVEADFWGAFTGQSPAERQGSGWILAIHPDDVASVTATWREALRIGSATEFSYRARHNSGEYRWVLTKAVPIKNPDGSVREWVGTDEDIQARRAAQENLRINEERLRLALDAGHMVTWDYDIRTGYVTRSANAVEVLGAGSGPFEEIGRSIHPEDVARVRAALRRTHDSGDRYDIEYRIVDAAGATKWVRVRGAMLRNAHQDPQRIIGITFDITPEKKAEQEAQKARQELSLFRSRLEALASLTGGMVWSASPDAKIADIPAWRKFTGQSAEELQGWGWWNAIHPADRERLREALQRLIDSRSIQSAEYRVRSSTGDYVWFRSYAAPVLAADGSVLEWIGTSSPLKASVADDPAQRLDAAWVPTDLISGCQVRAARAIVRWSVRDLAVASGVSSSTIRRIEEDDGLAETRDTRKLGVLRATLEKAGVEFIPSPDGKGGVRPA